MNFNLEKSIQILEQTPRTLDTFLSGLDLEWTETNEGHETWTVYDIIGHLIHGEKTDWMTRLEIILQKEGSKTFTPFDRFAQFKDSQGKSLKELLDEFKTLRQRNIVKLRTLEINEGSFEDTGIHPNFGEVTLRQLLATWVVHDLNHLAQISRVMAKQYEKEVGPWKAFLGILNWK